MKNITREPPFFSGAFGASFSPYGLKQISLIGINCWPSPSLVDGGCSNRSHWSTAPQLAGISPKIPGLEIRSINAALF